MALDLIPNPLYLPKGSAVNPEFFSFVTIAFNSVIGLVALVQLLQITQAKEYGPNKIKYLFGSSLKPSSSGIMHQFRLVAIFIQFVLVLFLASLHFKQQNDGGLQFIALSLKAFIIGFVILPLHYFEPRRSIVQLSSTLFFWFFSLFLNLFSTIQDTISSHTIFSSSTSFGLTVEITLLLLNAYVIISQVYYWKPTKQLLEYYELNEWNPKQSRNVFDHLTYSWIEPTISKVYDTDEINFDELTAAPNYVNANFTLVKLQQYWDNSVFKAKQVQLAKQKKVKAKGGNPEDVPLNVSLFYPMFKAFLGPILTVGMLDLVEIFFSFAQPFLLQRFIKYFTEASNAPAFEELTLGKYHGPPKIVGFFIASAIYLFSVFRYFLFNQLYMYMFCLGFGYQSSLTTMIYNKALKLTPDARKNKSAGDVVNNVTMDINTLQWFCSSLSDFVSTPIKLTLCIFSLHKIIGNATFGGLLACGVLIPISSLVSASFMRFYPILMKHKDERTSLITEILNSVKSIKLYSWEKPMLERLGKIRNGKELKTLKKIGIYEAVGTFLWQCIPFFVSCASYATFVLLYDIPLTPEIVFPALSLFDMLTEPIFMLPNIITNLMEARTSLDRLRELFLMDELDNSFIDKTISPVKTGEVSVTVANATFVWSNKKKDEKKDTKDVAATSVDVLEEQIESNTSSSSSVEDEKSEVALKNINFTARKGQLTCVVGRVGSGKSTLFKALLGEVPVETDSEKDAKVHINGSIAYCSQSPWILNGSVKENILFGCKYDREFYLKTVDACELTSDFKTLPDGDATVVGEKGISLSGGQKARIALARAVYSKSDIYLLDDVLSAVDAHVGKNIIEKVLGPNGIINSKTKILATNSVPVLHDADLIYMLKKGEFVETGDFDEVMNRGADLATLIKDFGRKEDEYASKAEVAEHEVKPVENTVVKQPIPEIDILDEQIVALNGNEMALQRVISNETIGRASVTSYSHIYVDEDDDGKVKKTGNTNEGSEKGKVKLAIFLEYFKACNFGWITVYLLLSLAMMILKVGEKTLLTQWSEANSKAGKTVETHYFLTAYLLVGVIGGLLNLLAAFVLWSLCIIRGARYFHDAMAKSILRSPMRFFETTPVGRILNRFTDDIGTIDMQLPWTFSNFLNLLLNGIVTFAVICYNLPPMAIVLFILLIVYNQIRKYFIPCSRELKRLQSKSKSPQFAHIQESINGIDTVKAYGQEERFIFKNRQNVNKVVTIAYNNQACNRWLSMRLQSISSLLILFSSIFALLTIGGPHAINPSLVGFIMVYALSITFILNACVRMWAEVETQSVAVERLVEYCNLPSEAAEVIVDNTPPKSWPADGAIEFVNYSTRYADNLDNVLKNITISIKSNEKIGIVGRTGAGKSSLTLALFRIIESTSGHISIDGVNTSEIGLSDLRHQLSIIPQDAHTIEGSVRENLDPFQEYSDAELWRVLELAHLKDHVKSMKTEPSDKDKKENKDKKNLETKYELDATIFEGGSNLSAGQKQLLCLARALLNPSKVLLLDEATAAVDVQTDKIIQETIRSSFKDKTILIIAHRLETIMDSDKVLVLDHGEVREFDSPEELLKNKDGIFYLLCKEGGYLPASKDNTGSDA